MKTSFVFVSIFCVAAALWLAIMEFVLRHPGYAMRAWIAVTIGAQCLAAMATILRRGGAAWRLEALFGSVLLAGYASHALYDNFTGNNFEGFALIIGAALVVQAAMTLWLIRTAPVSRD